MIRAFYLTAGFASLIVGAIGAFLPLLPTVPFFILAAFCFSRSSKRLHRWLLSRKAIGPVIADWEEYGIISRKAKRTATAVIVVLVSYPLFYLHFAWPLKAVLVLTIASVLTFIWSRPAEPPLQRQVKA